MPFRISDLSVNGTATIDSSLSVNSGSINSGSSSSNLLIQGGGTYPGGAIQFYGGLSPTSPGELLFRAGTGTGSQGERVRIGVNYMTITLANTVANKNAIIGNTSSNLDIYSTEGGGTTKNINLYTSGSSGYGGNFSLFANGNAGLGVTVDQGYKLYINGSLYADAMYANSTVSFLNEASSTGAIQPGQSEFISRAFNVAGGASEDISRIGLPSNTQWKAIITGGFANNYEGGGLVSPTFSRDIDSSNDTISAGSTSFTFSRNATTGRLQVTNNTAYRMTFVGTIQLITFPQSAKPTDSRAFFGDVGVNVASPSYPLHVYTGASYLTVTTNDGVGSALGFGINFRINNTGQDIAQIRGNYTDSTSGGSGGLRLYTKAAGTIASRIDIDPGGNVGIGVDGASKKLSVNYGASGSDGLFVYGSQRQNTIFRSTGEHCFLYIDSADSNIYLPMLSFQRLSTTYGVLKLERASSSDGLGNYTESEMLLGTTAAKPCSIQTDGTRRIVVTTAGEVLINTLTDSGNYKLQVSGSTYSSSGFFESSDIRLKTIVNRHESIDFGAIEFNWNDKRDSKLHWGYAAQEVMKFLPDAVNGSEELFYTLDYNQVHTYKIAMLEKRIAELESQLKNK